MMKGLVKSPSHFHICILSEKLFLQVSAGDLAWPCAMKPVCVCVRVCSVAKSCPILCDPRDCSPPGSSVHGISQARRLEWIAISLPGDLPDPGIKPVSSVSTALADGFFTTEPAGKP